MSKSSTVCAGIDTGKHRLDVAVHDSTAQLQVGNDPHGHAQLSAWLARQGASRVGIEASGGYERAVVERLRQDGLEVVLLQPAQVRAYALFQLRRAKNDRLDAALIAATTAALKVVHAPADPRFSPLAGHLTYIEQIEADITRHKTRLETCREARIQELWKAEIARLKAHLREELKGLARAVRQHTDLARRLDLIASVQGIGERTALAILVRMPEIGRLSREQAAALAGLAPYDDDSGERAGARRIAGGRGRLRNSLYNAALPAAFRWNPQLIALYRRLTAKGKPHKLVLVACARKLIIYANTVVQRQAHWTKTIHAT
ncbi:MAG: IS110 family transposase [Phycisphaeraceae bacterium]|nr:IS110 family transposase [Phycisphaeraceae bacterium]MCW8141438.1 IS110 family transposase [Planctomycetota bacterium]